VSAQGTLVPLSRGMPCTATRADGTTAHCGYTDGDLVTPGVVEADAASAPVKSVTIDLGATQRVAEVRDRCGCTREASTDGRTWFNLPRGEFGAQKMRYVRVSTAGSLAIVPEISVWPPWPESHNVIRDPRSLPHSSGGSAWALALVALLLLLGVLGGWALGRRQLR
jgi:hypothetical protein